MIFVFKISQKLLYTDDQWIQFLVIVAKGVYFRRFSLLTGCLSFIIMPRTSSMTNISSWILSCTDEGNLWLAPTHKAGTCQPWNSSVCGTIGFFWTMNSSQPWTITIFCFHRNVWAVRLEYWLEGYVTRILRLIATSNSSRHRSFMWLTKLVYPLPGTFFFLRQRYIQTFLYFPPLEKNLNSLPSNVLL